MSGHKSCHQRGGIFFTLLLGIALFAALSYAVTQAVRTSSGTLSISDQEEMRLALSELQDTVEAHRVAVRNMVLNGVPVDNISAEDRTGADSTYYPTAERYFYSNPNCTNAACELYATNGGPLNFYMFPVLHKGLTVEDDVGLALRHGIFWSWWEGKGTLATDLHYVETVSEEFCNFINVQSGINIDINDAANDVALATSMPLDGSVHGDGAIGWQLGGSSVAPYLSGKNQGCIRSSATYYYVAFVYAQ